MKLAAAAALLFTVSTPALAQGQLPRTVVPVSYDITVTPNPKAFDAKLKPSAEIMTFTGTETVQVDVKQPTRTIVLNAAELQISRATFDGKPATFVADPKSQQLTLTLPTEAKAGAHTLTFAWSGKLNSTAAGFFFTDYSNPDGSPARMLATQFEAPDARRFAPMWDEPSFKAKFTVNAVTPAGQTAFSNMPATKITKQGDGSSLYAFGQSPVMSSYLLFLGLGDVERKTIQAGNTEIGVITRKGVVDQGDYSLTEAKRLLAYYNDYFGQTYPLPKMDMIAGPGSSQFFGAMENWGAIFYFENELLVDPQRTTQSGRERIFTVVAHEMAHQWFGDLVTMSWWDDLWLNEGFASWMESKSSGDLNPTWGAKETAVAGSREGAMAADGTAATHPIIRHIETVDQMGEAFDGITYAKGEAVINMLESTLGADAFRTGIRSYMAKYKYGNTQTDQLWAELEKAAGKPVKQIADSFTLQGGVPLVSLTSAKCVGGNTQVVLSQGRWGLDAPSKTPQTWYVPMTLATVGGQPASAVVTGASTPVTVQGCGTLILNRDKGSYVRTKYDAPTHAALVKDFTRLQVTDQLGTLGDDMALAMSGDQDMGVYFNTLGGVPAEASPIVWSMVTGHLGAMGGLVQGTPAEAQVRVKSNRLLAPVLRRVGYEQQAGESPLVTNLREGLIGRLGVNGDAEVAAKARSYVAALKTNPAAIPVAIRQPILTTYAVNATPAEWDQLLEIAKAEKSPVAKNGYIRLLGVARENALAQRALDLLKTDTFTTQQKAGLLSAIAGRHPDMAFDFAVANVDLVNSFLETSTRARYIVALGQGSNDPAMPGKIQAFATKYLDAGAQGSAQRVLAVMSARKQVVDRVRPAIVKWAAAK